jgi:hypothetical protein
MVLGQPRKKEFARPYLNRKKLVWWHMPIIPVKVGSLK